MYFFHYLCLYLTNRVFSSKLKVHQCWFFGNNTAAALLILLQKLGAELETSLTDRPWQVGKSSSKRTHFVMDYHKTEFVVFLNLKF